MSDGRRPTTSISFCSDSPHSKVTTGLGSCYTVVVSTLPWKQASRGRDGAAVCAGGARSVPSCKRWSCDLPLLAVLDLRGHVIHLQPELLKEPGEEQRWLRHRRSLQGSVRVSKVT